MNELKSHIREAPTSTALEGTLAAPASIWDVEPTGMNHVSRFGVQEIMAERLRVAILLPQLSAGGVETSMQTLAYGLQNVDVEVEIVANKASELDLELMPPVPIVLLGASRLLFAIPPLVRYLRARRPDVLISSPTAMNVAAILAALVARSSVCLCLNEQSNLSLDLTREYRSSARLKLLPLLIRTLYRYADGIVAPSPAPLKDPLFARMVGHLDISTAIIPNPIRWDAQASAADRFSDPWLCGVRTVPTMVAVGRLVEQKATDILLEALGKLKGQGLEVRLIILGDGPKRHSLEQLAEKLDIGNWVRFAGFVPDAIAYIARADAFIMPSRWEGFSMARLEAMACGTPMVLSDAAAEAGGDIVNETNALVVPVDDAGALASAIARLITDRELASSIGENARKTSATYNPRAIAEQYLEFIQTLREPDAVRVTKSQLPLDKQ